MFRRRTPRRPVQDVVNWGLADRGGVFVLYLPDGSEVWIRRKYGRVLVRALADFVSPRNQVFFTLCKHCNRAITLNPADFKGFEPDWNGRRYWGHMMPPGDEHLPSPKSPLRWYPPWSVSR
jgi:hypothetical protein